MKRSLMVLSAALPLVSVLISQAAMADVFVRRGSDPSGPGTKMVGIISSRVSTLDSGMTVVGKSAKASAKELSVFISAVLARKAGMDLLTLANLISERKVDLICETLDGQVASNIEVNFASH